MQNFITTATSASISISKEEFEATVGTGSQKLDSQRLGEKIDLSDKS